MASPRTGAMAAGRALPVAVLRSLAGLRSHRDGQRCDNSEHGEDTLHLLLLIFGATLHSMHWSGARPTAPLTGAGGGAPPGSIINRAPDDGIVTKVATFVHLCRAAWAYAWAMNDPTHLDASQRHARLIEIMMDPDYPLVRAALELLAPINEDAATALRVTQLFDPVIESRRAQQSRLALLKALGTPSIVEHLRANRDDPIARDLLWAAERLG